MRLIFAGVNSLSEMLLYGRFHRRERSFVCSPIVGNAPRGRFHCRKRPFVGTSIVERPFIGVSIAGNVPSRLPVSEVKLEFL